MDKLLQNYVDRIFNGAPCVLVYEDMFDSSIKVVCVDGSNIIQPPLNEAVFDTLMEVFVSVSSNVIDNTRMNTGNTSYTMTCSMALKDDTKKKKELEKIHANGKKIEEYMACIMEHTDSFFVAYMEDYKKKVVKIHSKNMLITESHIDLAVSVATDYCFGDDLLDDEPSD